MRDALKFYIDGQWIEPASPRIIDVIDPATEAPCGRVALGSTVDVDKAVAAARRAFESFSRTSREERLDLLKRIIAAYDARSAEMAEIITCEMGAPSWLAQRAQAPSASGHFRMAAKILETYPFEETKGSTLVVKEPIGVCGFITPWNWPVNQIAAKVAPALATGCTVVLKPSEIAPLNAQLFAEIMDEAGVPAGVFNLVHGDGPTVGAAIAAHPDVDMVSFTGSTRAGVAVAQAAAPTVKRVHQELGGKSPNILLDDEGFAAAVEGGVKSVMTNSGQSCNAPTRMLVPAARMEEAAATAARVVEGLAPGDPKAGARMGPVVSEAQFAKIQGLIETGVAEGATVAAGGPGRPEGLDKGYFVRPTVFSGVTNAMTVAREEIFGPVLVIIPYADLDEAVAVANDTEYGLAAYVSGQDGAKVREIAARLRAGQVILNGAGADFNAPFGGYKKSGNGREWGEHAFSEFLEIKAILGYGT